MQAALAGYVAAGRGRGGGAGAGPRGRHEVRPAWQRLIIFLSRRVEADALAWVVLG